MNWALWDWDKVAFYQPLISAYEKLHPDIKINQTYIPFADYLTQLTIRFASNRAPALLQISEQNYGAYAAQGWLAGLDEYIAGTDIETGWASAQKDLTWDGERFARLDFEERLVVRCGGHLS